MQGQKILFFDTETNGLAKDNSKPASASDNWPRLVELAYIQTDIYGNVIEQKSNLIKPYGFEISEEAMKIHGITQEMATQKGTFLSVALTDFYAAMSECSYMVAHGMSFDYNVVASEWLRVMPNTKFKKIIAHKICTMKSSCEFMKEYLGLKIKQTNGPSLKELHFKLFNKIKNTEHRALEDAKTAKDCFFELKNLGVLNL